MAAHGEIQLEVKDLTKTFELPGKPPFTAVDKANFALRKGETLAIVGESGSGKSTIAKMITRLYDSTSGSVLLRGKDVTRAAGRDLRDMYREMQMIFQSPTGSFDPRRTLGHGICESMINMGRSKGEARDRAVMLLEQCGLSAEFYGRYPHQVSGGQCQRAAIARALAIEPKILICDEATSALDTTIQRQIIDLLIKLREENGISYIVICHNLAVVQAFCSTVLVLYRGKTMEYGTPDEVIMHPKTDYTKNLIDSVLTME